MSTKHPGSLSKGFTLVELMIAVAILAIVAAIAIPAYNGYIRESRLGAMRMNLDTLRIAVEAFRLDSAAGSYKPGAATSYAFDLGTSTTIESNFGWAPEGDGDRYAYTVTPTPTTYALQATFKPDGLPWVVCDRDPAKTPVFKCCDGKTGTPPASCTRP